MIIMSIRGASALPVGGDIIAGVWSGGSRASAVTVTPYIPGAVEVIVVHQVTNSLAPTTGMTVIHADGRCRIFHGPPQGITSSGAGLTVATAIGFTQPITPTVTPATADPGLITFAGVFSGDVPAVNLPGVQWQAGYVEPKGFPHAVSAVSALALVDSPHTWTIPGAQNPVMTTITW